MQTIWGKKIDEGLCKCDVAKTCNSETSGCKNINDLSRHLPFCTRWLCEMYELIRNYNFYCYKMIFTKEPIQFEFYVKQLLKIIHTVQIGNLEHVVPTKHCYHSNDYQDHKKCTVFEPSAFCM